MKKSIAILLALLMMAGTLGCSSENAEEKETAQSNTISSVGETEAQESETEEETEASVFAGIEEKKFDGRNFNFLYRTTEEYQFYAEEYTGDAINDAVHDRNLLVESTFDTKIGIVNKCAVEKYPKSQAAVPPVPPVRIFDGGSPCGLKLFTRMVL